MAERLVFRPTPHEKCKYAEKEYRFKYYTGFAISQKQKSVASLHDEVRKEDGNVKILEVSTKSTERLGIMASAFNLKMDMGGNVGEVPIENVFQSSKKFEFGGPYRDLLYISPKEAKKDERLLNSGKLIAFNLGEIDWPLEPQSLFYDWIYIKALHKKGLQKEILKYDFFTDIEFNHKKSINCQARAIAIYSSIIQLGIEDKVLNDKIEFTKLYGIQETDEEQLSFII